MFGFDGPVVAQNTQHNRELRTGAGRHTYAVVGRFVEVPTLTELKPGMTTARAGIVRGADGVLIKR